MYGWFDFSDQLSGPDYTAVTSGADMIQIIVSFDDADVGGDYLPSEIIIRHNGEYHSYILDGDER